MNWPLLWEITRQVIFWFFLLYGLLLGGGNMYPRVDADYRRNWTTAGFAIQWMSFFLFLVCLVILGVSLRIFG
jgi:hypothetical protein